MSEKSADTRAHLVGLNHVALEVKDVGEALAFYQSIFRFPLRGRGEGRAFLDMGDQFLALFEGRSQSPDQHRHFGLVVDDKEAVRRRLQAFGVKLLPGEFLDFRDPSGNRIQIVSYADIQFTKTSKVLEAMGLAGLEKSRETEEHLREKGLVD